MREENSTKVKDGRQRAKERAGGSGNEKGAGRAQDEEKGKICPPQKKAAWLVICRLRLRWEVKMWQIS